MSVNEMMKPDSVSSDRLQELVQQSLAITRHVDLFLWMQGSVREMMPHDVMIAAWGNFSSGRLNYDVISSISEVRTQHLIDARENIDALMGSLFGKWQQQDEQWFVMNRFSSLDSVVTVPANGAKCFMDRLHNMKSLLVYGIHDLRGHNDSLYVFFDAAAEFPLRRLSLEMLMPHIDLALRRIEMLVDDNQPPEESGVVDEECSRAVSVLSEREKQIMKWVKLGKSNHEIGAILDISPNTVKNHLKRIFDKLGVSSRLQALNRCGNAI